MGKNKGINEMTGKIKELKPYNPSHSEILKYFWKEDSGFYKKVVGFQYNNDRNTIIYLIPMIRENKCVTSRWFNGRSFFKGDE